MSAKKLLVSALIASLLTACGGNAANQTALPGDGTYDDAVVQSDYDTSGDLGGNPALPGNPGATPGGMPTGGTSGDGQIGDPTGDGFTLKGLVVDPDGKPVAGAKVSIGAQTTLSNDKGEFEISAITDTQIWVDVTKDGFEPISRFNVAFTADKPVADKEFKLAKAGAGSGSGTGGGTGTGSGGGTGGTTDPEPTGPKLSNEGTFGGPEFRSVAAMAVDGDRVYVLGVIDKKLWFDRAAVVVFDADSGEEVARIGDALFSKMPKNATSLRVDDGEVVVSDGSARYTFDSAGTFVKKASGGSFETVKSVTDSAKGITYTIKGGTRVEVDSKTFDGTLKLEEVGNARALGLTDDGHLLVLDDSNKAVHRFSFE